MLRYHPDDPRSSMSGYEGNLTTAQQTALEELTSAVEDLDLRMVTGDYGSECLGGDHAIEPLRLLLLRFLRGNGFSVQKALSQLKECVEYRAKHAVDQLLSKSPSEVLGCNPDQYHSLYAHWFMGFDRLGRPMLVQQFRNLRTWEAVKMTTIERMAELHAREQELLLRALRRQTLESGGRQGGTTAGGDGERSYIVDSVVIVVDTGGLALRHVTRDFVRLFKLRSFTDQLLFPEMMGKCIIVNTPSLFGYVWAMFSPMVDARTRDKIDVIPRPADYEAALRKIADPDQISPEYGGTGPAHADRLSIADALQAAGSRGGFRIGAGRVATEVGGSSCAEPGGLVGVDANSVAVDSVRPQESAHVDGNRGSGGIPMAFDPERRQEQEPRAASGDDLRDETGGDARADWFSGTWSAFGGLWGKQPDVRGDKDAAGLEPDVDGGGSIASVDEDEFFDALSELDELMVQRRDGQGEVMAEAKAWAREGQVVVEFHGDSAGDELNPSSPSGRAGASRRRRGRLPAVDESEMDAVESTDRRYHSAAVVAGTKAVECSGGGASGASCRKTVFSLAILGWCLKPAVVRLSRCELEKLVRWLCIGNAVSALLAVASIVVGALSMSTSWRGAIFGWQWTAIASVCFGCLLLLLSLVGTAGARLRNRFTLLGFAALEGAVAIGTILMGAWCFALASGSATISDLTWDAISEERGESMTEEEFLEEARGRLIALGVSGLVLPVYSVAGPCLLSLALSDKIRQLEGEAGAWRDGKKRFAQLGQWFQEVNVVLTAFAMVCTGYGGWALSYTISLGLTVGVTSTYLMLAGGYILLLAGAVSAWAARSGYSEAYRLHFFSLVPAGVLYAALTVIQLVRAQSSNSRIEAAWVDLHPEGEELSRVQARVKTMLIVGGIVSAVTFLLGIAALVASWATRRALLQLDDNGFANHGKTWRRLSRGEKGAIVWALALAVTSTFLDGSFAVFSAWLARESEQVLWLVEFWRAMGRGDKRYVEGDTFVVATAVVVAAVIGPGSLLYAWSVYCRKGFRFSVGILVCTASLYTQVLRYVTKPGGSSSHGQGGNEVVFIVATVVLGLLQVVGALVVLLYNIRRMTVRVHAAEVQYRALLSENEKIEAGEVDSRCDSE